MSRLKIYDLATATWIYVGGVDPVALATDPAFTSRFFSGTSGAGAPAGTGTANQWYYDTTNKRLYQSDGVGWIIMFEPDQTYVPALTNVTIGTATQINTGIYRRSNGQITLSTSLKLGTGGAYTGTPTVALPSGITAGAVSQGMLRSWYFDQSVPTQYDGIGEIAASSSVIFPRIDSVSGTFIATVYVAAASPVTWAVNDELKFFGTIPMNSKYT